MINTELVEAAINLLEEQGREVVYRIVPKNGEEVHTVSIKEEGRSISPILYLEPIFDVPFPPQNAQELAAIILATHYRYLPEQDSQLDFLTDIDYVRENIFVALAPGNSIRTSEVTKDFLDLKEVLKVKVTEKEMPSVKDKDGQFSIAITEGIAEIIKNSTGLSLDELFAIAESNLEKDAYKEKMLDVMENILKKEAEALPAGLVDIFIKEERARMKENDLKDSFALSNTERYYGAGQMLNKAKLREIAEELQSDKLLIVPTSIHELVIADYSTVDTEKALEGLYETNKLEPTDNLSDHYYVYDSKKDAVLLPGVDTDEVADKIVKGIFK